MSTLVDDFLLKAFTKNAQTLASPQQTDKDVDLPIFIPLMTLDRFSTLTGIPRGVLQGNCDRGYIPTHVIGRRRVVNVSLLNQLLLEREVCHG